MDVKNEMFENELKSLLNRYNYEIATQDENSITISKKKYVPTKKWQLRCPKCNCIIENKPENWNSWIQCECGNEMFMSYPPDHPLYKQWKEIYEKQNPPSKILKSMEKFANTMENSMLRRVDILKDLEEKVELTKPKI